MKEIRINYIWIISLTIYFIKSRRVHRFKKEKDKIESKQQKLYPMIPNLHINIQNKSHIFII